jgi:tripartite-type tricarboxylate transporter receptor subunit TctC
MPDPPFVPFPGGAPAVNALLGGHVTTTFTTYSITSEQVTAGKLRVLASASRMRPDALCAGRQECTVSLSR